MLVIKDFHRSLNADDSDIKGRDFYSPLYNLEKVVLKTMFPFSWLTVCWIPGKLDFKVRFPAGK